MPEASAKRTFNDMDDEIDENKEWNDKLHSGLGLPRKVIDEAGGGNFDTLTLLLKVKEWVTTKVNSSLRYFPDQEYELPVGGWQDNFSRHFPDTPQHEYEQFPNDDYGKWRHLVLFVLKKSIEGFKQQVSGGRSDCDTIYKEIDVDGSDGRSSKRSSTPPLRTGKSIGNLKPMPPDFTATNDFMSVQKKFTDCTILQLYGGQLSGKTYYVHGLLRTYSKTTPSGARPDIIWYFDCDQSEFSFNKEFENFAKYLADKKVISSDELENQQKSSNELIRSVLELLQKNKVNAIFAFENVNADLAQDVRKIISVLTNFEDNSNNEVKVIITTRGGKDSIYDQLSATRLQGLMKWPVKTYTDEEAADYLVSEGPSEIVCYRYNADDRKVRSEKLLDPIEAKPLARYFENNPGCLRAAKVYCLTRRITFKQYLESMEVKSSRNLVVESEAEIMHSHDPENAKAFQALRNLTSFDGNSTKATKRMEKVLNVLSFVNHEDIPVHLIGKICQLLRPDNAQLSAEENFELNRNEASDVVYRMEEVLSFEHKSSINYPNGIVTVPKAYFDALREDPESGGDDLLVALEAMAKMTSKDNTERNANMRLLQLRPHIDEISKHANKFLKANFNVKDKKKDSFKVAMLVCRLFELLSQAYVQGRLHITSISSLEMLIQAAALVWEIVTAYNRSKFSVLTCVFRRQKLEDALEYAEGNDPKEQGARIAEICWKAGRKVGAETLMDYWKASIFFNKRNLQDFIQNATEMMNGRGEEAKEKLKNINTLIEKALPCQPSDIQVLRETGNLLTGEQLENSFFAERLSSIFHTLGRQVLYLQDKLSETEQKKCQYYTDLAHYIAKATREKTGVGLLNEYITLANAKVPRMLQNRKNETNAERKSRLQEGYRLSKELLNVTCKYYENACFRLVKDTGYTKLNAYKYMVKANTKMMKDSNATLPESALDECKETWKLAKDNSSLDMSPHCIINAARFFATTGHFQEAFQAYADGFEYKNHESGDLSGMIHLRDWRPNSFAWASHNYCQTVEAYSKQECIQKVQEKRAQAYKYCQQVLQLDNISKEWQDRMENWSRKFKWKLDG